MKFTLLGFTLTFIIVSIFSTSIVNAQQVQKTISHQGVLLDDNGDAVEDDTYIFTFSIYADSTEGTALWQSDRILPVKNGKFNVQLGSKEPLDIPFDQQYWVGVAIDGGNELSPRLPLSATPYALHAYTIADTSVSNNKIVDGAVTAEKLANGAITNEKLNDQIELSNHTSFGALNHAFTEVTDSWTKLDMGTKTFQKTQEHSKIELELHSRASSGSFNGASWIKYEFRINGNSSVMSSSYYIFSDNTTEYITLKAIFENLPKGEHEVEVWAQTDAGSSSNVGLDPGGYRGEIFVKESH